MSHGFDIQEGMQVYGGDQLIGRVERLHGDGFHVNGRHYTQEMVTHVEHNRIYLGDSGAAGNAALTGQATGGTARVDEFAEGTVTEGTTTEGRITEGAIVEGALRVPVVEERLAVGKREVDLGEVDIRKTVTTEEQTASVTLRRDEVHVEEVTVTERPATGPDLFEEGTIRVQLRGEEAVVGKETVVTGEVVIDKETVAEERTITDTVRKQRVEVEEQYLRERAGFEQEFAARSAGTGRTFADAEPNYRTGFEAAHDERYAGREFEAIEPEMQRDYVTRGVGSERWAELREDIRSGWNKARNR